MRVLNVLSFSFLLIMGTAAADSGQNIFWQLKFSNNVPIKSNTTQAYCNSHVPDTLKASIAELSSKTGVSAANAVNIRYGSYKVVNYDNVSFTFVTAKLSGQDSSGKWSDTLKLYQEAVTPNTQATGVWSTSKCHGSFLGAPVLLMS